MRGVVYEPWGVMRRLYVCISPFVSGVGGWLVLIEGWQVGDFVQLLECSGEINGDDSVCRLCVLPVFGWLVWC